MKNLNLNLNSRLTDANNITISSQKALKTYIDSKRILLNFLQDSAPTTFQTGNTWLNTSNLKLYTATSSSNWDSGINITTNELYTFNNVLYHYDGTNLSIYSTDSIKEQNSGNETKIWIGTQSEYDNLDSYDNNTIYNIIDTTSVVSALLATQQEFNNSAQDRAATPYQVNQKIGNYMPLAGGNFDTGAVVRFTNGNGTNSISYDSSNVLNITNNVSVGNNLTANNIVATSGNIYKTNTSGDTVVWSSTLNNYLPLTGGTLTGDLNFNKSGAHYATISTHEHALTISVGNASLGVAESDGYSGLYYFNGTISRYPVYTDTKAVANGVATLDSNTKVPTTQLPLATNSTVGAVQGDGTTTSVDANGVISVIGGGGGGNAVWGNITGTLSNQTDLQNALNDKVNVSSLTEAHVVIETYVNGTDWYRIWSDGWCEQGGYITSTNNTAQNINLLKSYVNTDYFVTTQQVTEGATVTDFYGSSKIIARTTTYFTFVNGQSELPNYVWKAEGYIS